MTTRRDVLQLALLAAAAATLPRTPAAATARPGTPLILGGTGCRAVHDRRPCSGLEGTHFNRSRTAADGVSNVETLIGDHNSTRRAAATDVGR
jgi:hypothetical protein